MRSASASIICQRAAWFIDHYPLLGGLAAHFKIVEDYQYCVKNEISVAAVSVYDEEIYINSAVRYTEQQWRFVLAHEYLHAGLGHQERCRGRDPTVGVDAVFRQEPLLIFLRCRQRWRLPVESVRQCA